MTNSTTPEVEGPLSALSLQASITATDLTASVKWYTEALGFTIDQRFEREGVWRAARLRAGGVALLLNQDDGKKGWDRIKGQGFTLMITTAQSIDEIAARAKSAGAHLESEPADMPWGARVFQLKDPDGILYTITSERRAPTA